MIDITTKVFDYDNTFPNQYSFFMINIVWVASYRSVKTFLNKQKR